MVMVMEMAIAMLMLTATSLAILGGRVREEDLQLAVREDGHGLPDERGGTLLHFTSLPSQWKQLIKLRDGDN